MIQLFALFVQIYSACLVKGNGITTMRATDSKQELNYARRVQYVQLLSGRKCPVELIRMQYVKHVLSAQLVRGNLPLVLLILIQYVSRVLHVLQGITLLHCVDLVPIQHVQRVIVHVLLTKLLWVNVVEQTTGMQHIVMDVKMCSVALLTACNGETTLCATDFTMELICVRRVQHAHFLSGRKVRVRITQIPYVTNVVAAQVLRMRIVHVGHL
jgi:hypothetical protein